MCRRGKSFLPEIVLLEGKCEQKTNQCNAIYLNKFEIHEPNFYLLVCFDSHSRHLQESHIFKSFRHFKMNTTWCLSLNTNFKCTRNMLEEEKVKLKFDAMKICECWFNNFFLFSDSFPSSPCLCVSINIRSKKFSDFWSKVIYLSRIVEASKKALNTAKKTNRDRL